MADRAPDGELPNLGLLIKLMKMTTSNVDHEALLAIRKANEQLVKFGGDWEALLSGKVTVIGDPFEKVPAPPPREERTGDWGDARRAPAPPHRPQPKPAPQPAPTPRYTAPPKPQYAPQPQPRYQAAPQKPTVTKRRFKRGSVSLEDLV